MNEKCKACGQRLESSYIYRDTLSAVREFGGYDLKAVDCDEYSVCLVGVQLDGEMTGVIKMLVYQTPIRGYYTYDVCIWETENSCVSQILMDDNICFTQAGDTFRLEARRSMHGMAKHAATINDMRESLLAADKANVVSNKANVV